MYFGSRYFAPLISGFTATAYTYFCDKLTINTSKLTNSYCFATFGNGLSLLGYAEPGPFCINFATSISDTGFDAFLAAYPNNEDNLYNSDYKPINI